MPSRRNPQDDSGHAPHTQTQPPPPRPPRPAGADIDLRIVTSRLRSASAQDSHLASLPPDTPPRELPVSPTRPSPVAMASTVSPFGSLSRRRSEEQGPRRPPSPSRFAAGSELPPSRAQAPKSPAQSSAISSGFRSSASDGSLPRRPPSPSRFAAVTPPMQPRRSLERSPNPSPNGSLRRPPSPSRFAPMVAAASSSPSQSPVTGRARRPSSPSRLVMPGAANPRGPGGASNGSPQPAHHGGHLPPLSARNQSSDRQQQQQHHGRQHQQYQHHYDNGHFQESTTTDDMLASLSRSGEKPSPPLPPTLSSSSSSSASPPTTNPLHSGPIVSHSKTLGLIDLLRILAGNPPPSSESANPLLTPRNLRLIFLSAFFILALSIALPWTFQATGCLGARAEDCYIQSLEECSATFPCSNRGVPFLTVEGQCACDCPAPFVGPQCVAEAQCPCVPDPDNPDPKARCLSLSSTFSPLFTTTDTALLALGLDRRALAMAMTLAQVPCQDQPKVMTLPVNQRRIQLGGSQAARRMQWAKVIAARHMQLSGNFNVSRDLAVKFTAMLNATTGPTANVLGADPDTVAPGVAQVSVERIVYDLGTLRVSYLPATLTGQVKSVVDAKVPAGNVRNTFTTLVSIASAMSQLRSGFLALYWTQRLGLPIGELATFRTRVQQKPLMVSLDAVFPEGGSADSPNVKFMGQIHASRQVFGSPFCTFLFPGDFQALNAIESASFRLPPFDSQRAAVGDCLTRPTYATLNLADLRTGAYPSESTQQALVLTNDTRLRATFSATTLLPRAGNADRLGAAPSAERMGVVGAMDHVLVEFLMSTRDDKSLLALIRRVVADTSGVPDPGIVASGLALPAAHVWGGVATGNVPAGAPDVDYLVAGLSSRVGSGGVRPDLFFATPLGQVDPAVSRFVLDPADREQDRAAFNRVWEETRSGKLKTPEEIWDALPGTK
ncbi:hypothetical protein BCR44DRAFT_1440549 [Catenaria anguillulae PL171]|uniref:EGF-like domain-containing protein n=1 Tax=Catenaria anguillulae PL171 TaxID=765915 RepID=A0A1Y2HF48_9FUNG|nr:hypothetical protein BCR44DRAFT_1440549 [Catenaria anguillulae PL171]